MRVPLAMATKIRDTVAREMLPAWLASLALLLAPVGLDSTCTHLRVRMTVVAGVLLLAFAQTFLFG